MVFSILGQIVAVITAGMIVRIASDAISVARKVADFRVGSSTDQPASNKPSQVTANLNRNESPSEGSIGLG
jgi:hypothetical protein